MVNSIHVLVPTPLRQYTDGKDVVEMDAATVSEALAGLTDANAQLRRHLYGEDGRLRSFVNVYLNDQDIRYLETGFDTPVKEGDEIRIVPSIAGGATTTGVEETHLSRAELQRYARHLIMPEVGMAGQKRLKQARVLLVGAGGLGSPASLYLAAAGVGTLGLVDSDRVELSNLQRQIIHGTPDVGRSKLDSARERVLEINPEVRVETHETRLTSENALELLSSYDVVVDGTDNFPTRYLINDACVLLGKPNVYGSIFRFEGQASVFYAERGPCYRCLYQEPPPPGLVPSCAEGGVLGVLPGLIGTFQANETIKLILGAGEPLIGRLLLVDALKMRFREVRLRKDPECPICGDNPTIHELIDYEAFCGVGERETPAPKDVERAELSATELKARLDAGDPITIVDVREPYEWDICNLPSARLIPLRTLPSRLDELDDSAEIVVLCRTGQRSASAVKYMRDAGFARAYNLTGGLWAWSDEVDPAMPKY